MIAAPTYEFICRELKNRILEQGQNHIFMVGLLFARPLSLLGKEEIVPNIDYFNERSGKHIDFFCAGYGAGEGVGSRAKRLDKMFENIPFKANWAFDEKLYVRFQKQVKKESNYIQSGGTDLILLNAKYDSEKDGAYLDYDGSAVLCYLDRMKHDGAIISVEMFFEEIVQYAESASGDDPTWGFSDERGIEIAGSALKRLVLSLLPRNLGEDVRRAAHFAVVDIGRS